MQLSKVKISAMVRKKRDAIEKEDSQSEKRNDLYDAIWLMQKKKLSKSPQTPTKN